MLTVDEKYLESSLVLPPLTHEAISSITSLILAYPTAITKHITPASPIFLINLIPIAFNVFFYSNYQFVWYSISLFSPWIATKCRLIPTKGGLLLDCHPRVRV